MIKVKVCHCLWVIKHGRRLVKRDAVLSRFSTPLGRALQLGDVELAHSQHGLRGAAGAIQVRVGEQLMQPTRHDLPGHSGQGEHSRGIRALKQRTKCLIHGLIRGERGTNFGTQ